MPKAHKHRKHYRHSSEPVEYKLLTYAALGQQRKVVKLFDRNAGIDVNFFDAHGLTSLHQVSKSSEISRRLCTGFDSFLTHDGLAGKSRGTRGNCELSSQVRSVTCLIVTAPSVVVVYRMRVTVLYSADQ